MFGLLLFIITVVFLVAIYRKTVQHGIDMCKHGQKIGNARGYIEGLHAQKELDKVVFSAYNKEIKRLNEALLISQRNLRLVHADFRDLASAVLKKGL